MNVITSPFSNLHSKYTSLTDADQMKVVVLTSTAAICTTFIGILARSVSFVVFGSLIFGFATFAITVQFGETRRKVVQQSLNPSFSRVSPPYYPPVQPSYVSSSNPYAPTAAYNPFTSNTTYPSYSYPPVQQTYSKRQSDTHQLEKQVGRAFEDIGTGLVRGIEDIFTPPSATRNFQRGAKDTWNNVSRGVSDFFS